MNKAQRVVVMLAAAICMAITLYPPWEFATRYYQPTATSAEEGQTLPIAISFGEPGTARQSGWLFSPPHSHPDTDTAYVKGFDHSILLGDLVARWALVLFPAIGLCAAFSSKQEDSGVQA